MPAIRYFDYSTLGPLLRDALHEPLEPAQDGWRILEIGCGDRPIVGDLVADAHFHGARAVAIDYAPSVIRKLRRDARVEKGCGGGQATALSYEQADARALRYDAGSFDLVLDKGTIDAMMCSDDAGFSNALQICAEAARVLKGGGVFVMVSHQNPTGVEGSGFLHDSLLPALLEQPAAWSWDISVHFEEAPSKSGPFVYIVRKTRRRLTRAVHRGEASESVPLRLHSY